MKVAVFATLVTSAAAFSAKVRENSVRISLSEGGEVPVGQRRKPWSLPDAVFCPLLMGYRTVERTQLPV
jgi:hypothetical protein